MLQRSDRLKEPPVLGRFYLVPSIEWRWKASRGEELTGGGLWWPVIGLKHNDPEFFGVHQKHYHVDPRFLTSRHWQRVTYYGGDKLDGVLASPLNDITEPEGPPKPTLRKMRCSRIDIPYGHFDQEPVCKLNESFAGTHCRKGKRGWVCPHRFIALGSMAPIDGVLTCFLHGLRIDAETGVCLGSPK